MYCHTRGTYYLGAKATTTSSKIGVIALASNDSNLVIENCQDERVVLSGGALLQLQWSVYAKTPTIPMVILLLKACMPINQDMLSIHKAGRIRLLNQAWKYM